MNKELENELLENEEQELYTQEEIAEIIGNILPEVLLDTEELNNKTIDSKEFEKGIKSVSEICGQYSALRSVGVDNNSAIDIIMNIMNVEYNKETNKQTCENNLEVAKEQSVNIQAQQL